MAKLGFRQFQSLLKQITKERLFDAVKPELQSYADTYFAHLKKPEAYQLIFDLAYKTCHGSGQPPVISNPVLLVQRMGAGRDGKGSYKSERIHAERMYFYFLFDVDLDDPGYASEIDSDLFEASFFDQFSRQLRRWDVARPLSAGPSKVARIGPIQVDFAGSDSSEPLLVDAPENCRLLDSEGQVEIYKALQWRFGLAKLRGRDTEMGVLKDWAHDGTNNLKVLLVSGPGGCGKTRLVTDFVTELKQNSGWSGGFADLEMDASDYQVDGTGAGIVLIFDYPEEASEVVIHVLKAATTQASRGRAFSKPVRIILVSREEKSFWHSHIRKSLLDYVDELNLSNVKHLDMNSATLVAKDIVEELPKRTRTSLATTLSVNADAWLHQNDSHRLALNITAAAVHAVLNPKSAFTLEAHDVLSALTLTEGERIRSYSKRSLGDPMALGRLLALSTLTSSGLTPPSIENLDRLDVRPESKIEPLLDCVKRTPFWVADNHDEKKGNLVRFEPDIFAAAFACTELYIQLDERCIFWLAAVCRLQGREIESVMPRYFFDLGIFSPSSVKNLQDVFIDMINRMPESVLWIWRIALRESTLTTEFSISVLEKILEISTQDEVVAYATSILTNHLANSGSDENALAVAVKATQTYEALAKIDPDSYLDDLARSKGNLVSRLASVGKTEQARTLALEVDQLFRELYERNQEEYSAGLAVNCVNLGKMLTRNDPSTALNLLKEARNLFSELSKRDPAQFMLYYAGAILGIAEAYETSENDQRRWEMGSQAARILQTFSNEYPEIDFFGLAGLRFRCATLFLTLGKPEDFCNLLKITWNDFVNAALTSPDIFLDDARSLLENILPKIDLAYAEKGLGSDQAKYLISHFQHGFKRLQDSILPKLAAQIEEDLPGYWARVWSDTPILDASWESVSPHQASVIIARIDLSQPRSLGKGSFAQTNDFKNARRTTLDFGISYEVYEFEVEAKNSQDGMKRGVVAVLACKDFTLLLDGSEKLSVALETEGLHLDEEGAKAFLKFVLCFTNQAGQPNRVIEKPEDIEFSEILSDADQNLIRGAINPIERIADPDAASKGAMTFELSALWYDVVRRMQFSVFYGGKAVLRRSADMFDCSAIVKRDYFGICRRKQQLNSEIQLPLWRQIDL